MRTQNAVLLSELKKRRTNKRNIIDVLTYEPETGFFRWRANAGRHGRIPAGTIAGTIDNTTGYIRIQIDGRRYYAHRLALFFVYGKWPTYYTDHIDGNRVNNSITNLREATPSQNRHNSNKSSNKKASRFKGVCWHRNLNKWGAQIQDSGDHFHLGLFKSEVEAAMAYNLEAARRFGSFCKLNDVRGY